MGIVEKLKKIEYSDNVIVVDDDLLQRIQDHLTGMMKDIVPVLEKHGIRWSLSGGSIIGAVRHHGFIPWDDDIDLFMERKEFEKFKRVFKEELSSAYELKLPGDPGYLFHFPQIQDKRTKIKSIQSVGDECEGLFIDIFILENTYQSKFLRTLHGIQCTIYLFILSALRMKLCRENIVKYSNHDPEVEKEVNKRARFAFLFAFRPMEAWLKKADRCFGKVSGKSEYVVVPSGGHHFFGEIFDRKEMCELVKADFNGESWYIPKGYDYYLTNRYGRDYMVIPEAKDRERHIYAQLDLGGPD